MTEMNQERREELKRRAPTPEEVDALLADSAWRERVERQVRELADELTPYEVLTGEDEIHGHLAGRLRAIVDTGEPEGE